MNNRFSSSSRIVTLILVASIVIFSTISIFVLTSAYQREQESIRRYTNSQMNALTLDLDAKLMSVESAMLARSHMKHAALADSTLVYGYLEQVVTDLAFVRNAGITYYDGVSDYDTTLYVDMEEDGTFRRFCMNETFEEYKDSDREAFLRSIESGKTEWSSLYDDEAFSGEIVTTCYKQMGRERASLCVDVYVSSMLEMIDSLQFCEGSRLYISIPSQDRHFTLENGTLVCLDKKYVLEKGYTEIATDYPRLGLQIVNVVPQSAIYDRLMTTALWGLVIFIAGLAALSVIVYLAFQKAQKRLAESIRKSNEEALARKRLEDEVSIAADIQQKMLTDPGKNVRFVVDGAPTVDVMAKIIPAREVGGDLYEYRLEGDLLHFCVGDVSGKGVPSSLVMSMCGTLFSAYVSNTPDYSPDELLTFLNRQLCRGNEEVMFVTLWAGVLNVRTGHLRFASAGHNAPVLVKPGSASFLEMKQGLPLGMFDDAKYQALEMQLDRDAALLLYTDGITEAEGPGLDLFGDARLLEACSDAKSVCTEVLSSSILSAVHKHAAGQSQSDDITLLCLSYGGDSVQLHGIKDVVQLHELSASCGFAEPDKAALVLEEMTVNAFSHGNACFVSAEYRDGRFTIQDDGEAFDPTLYEPEHSDELKIGGLGLSLVKQLCSEISYERTSGGLNRVTLLVKE